MQAKYLHERIRSAGAHYSECNQLRANERLGQSVYWQKTLEKTDDSTFLLLIFVWHAMYAWDEALKHLHEYICVLVSRRSIS